jgi:hypothetical protein
LRFILAQPALYAFLSSLLLNLHSIHIAGNQRIITIMGASDLQYSVDQEIGHFFEKTSTTRIACDTYTKEHRGGDVIPVAVQGVCSYTVYAGPNSEFVAQFRLKSLQLRMETMNLARAIYGHLAP